MRTPKFYWCVIALRHIGDDPFELSPQLAGVWPGCRGAKAAVQALAKIPSIYGVVVYRWELNEGWSKSAIFLDKLRVFDKRGRADPFDVSCETSCMLAVTMISDFYAHGEPLGWTPEAMTDGRRPFNWDDQLDGVVTPEGAAEEAALGDDNSGPQPEDN